MLEESRRRVVTDAGSGASTRRKLRFVPFDAHSVDNTILTFEHSITSSIPTPIKIFVDPIRNLRSHSFFRPLVQISFDSNIQGVSGASSSTFETCQFGDSYI